MIPVISDMTFVQLFYTTGFSGQKFYIVKVCNLRHCSLKAQQNLKALDISTFEHLLIRNELDSKISTGLTERKTQINE